MFYGDWLNDHKGLRQFFVEIQVKRISGADDALLEKCGIHPEFVWLSLHDENAAPIKPMVIPPLISHPVPPSAPARQLPIPGQAAREPIIEVEEEEFAAPGPASSIDKGKGKAVAPSNQTTAAEDSAPVIVSSDARQSPQLPSISNLDIDQATAPDASPPSAGPSVPRTGIPRSQPLPASGSFDSLEAPQSEVSGTTDETHEDEGTVYLADDADPFATLIPAHQGPAYSAADIHRHRQDFDRVAEDKREELKRIFAFMEDPAFLERKKKSFVYAVRVVAIPDRGNIVNDFMGPRLDDRYGTHIAQGGWVVPPLEERVKWRDEHKRAYRNKGAKPGKYEGLPRAQVQNAMPMKFDWSAGLEPRYFGPAPPVWRELCDPCLEDINWMVWQLLAGKQFLGFQPGTGFGMPRPDSAGYPAILNQCPFKSPSAEALYHAASYPRGKETK